MLTAKPYTVKTWIHAHRFSLCIAGLIFLYGLSVLWHLGYLGLRVEEARRAIVALEMMESGNYIQPHTLGWVYYNKPPVFNWILTGFFSVTGDDSPFILRLPSFISILLLGLVHYLVARKFLSQRVALLSSLFTITAGDLYFYTLSNGGEIDVFYSLVVYLQVISIFYFYERGSNFRLFLFSWALCAIGFLTKGFTSPVFQVLTLAALCIYARSWKPLFTLGHLAGVILFFGITGAYFLLYKREGDPVLFLMTLLNESLNKSAVGDESDGRLFIRLFRYPVILLRVLAPWCFLALLFFKKPGPSVWQNPFLRFSTLFILLNIGVYWFTGAQKTRYVIMFIPFMMTLISYMFVYWENKNSILTQRYLRVAGILFLAVIPALLSLPLFTDIPWWKAVMSAAVMAVFLYCFNRISSQRIWFCVLGIILIRMAYAWIGIPLKAAGETDYRGLAKRFSAVNNNQRLDYLAETDTLKLAFYPEKILGKPVHTELVPWFLRYQVPYYVYRNTHSLPKLDTAMKPGKTYISFMSGPDSGKVMVLDYFYDRQFNHYVVLCRQKDESE